MFEKRCNVLEIRDRRITNNSLNLNVCECGMGLMYLQVVNYTMMTQGWGQIL